MLAGDSGVGLARIIVITVIRSGLRIWRRSGLSHVLECAARWRAARGGVGVRAQSFLDSEYGGDVGSATCSGVRYDDVD